MSAYREIGLLKVDEGAVEIDGKLYTFDVISRELAPTVPNFVGFLEGHLFISASVPTRFRRPILAHEVHCFAEKGKGHHGHCVAAVDYELTFVLSEDRAEYLALRRKFFDDLLTAYAETGDSDFIREATASRDYLHQLT